MPIIIRKEQLSEIKKNRIKLFKKLIKKHLFKCWPSHYEKKESKDGVTRFIDYALKKAECYEILGEKDTLKFIDFMIAWGDNFDTIPWIKNILKSTEISGSLKVHQINYKTKLILKKNYD